MNSPIFILGNPRSGTTLLRLMLNNHRNIVIPPECGFAVWFHDRYRNIIVNQSAIEQFITSLAKAKKIETWNLDFTKLQDFLIAMKPNNYPELVSLVYEFYGNSIHRSFLRWGDKNNFYIRHIDTIKEMFPSSRLIHIVRDGRDVACSYKALNRSAIRSRYAPHLPNLIGEIAHEWVSNLECAIDSFKKIGWQDVYELRYEDLTSQPSRELERLCVFLEEPYDSEMESYHLKNQSEQQEPVEFLQWKSKTLEQPTTSQIGRYKAELTKNEIEEFEKIAAPLLARYKYLSDR